MYCITKSVKISEKMFYLPFIRTLNKWIAHVTGVHRFARYFQMALVSTGPQVEQLWPIPRVNNLFREWANTSGITLHGPTVL